MPRSTAALLVTLLVAIGCDSERPSVRQPPALVPVPTAPEVLECRFDPVSRPGEQPENGFEMCFSPREPEPWWTRIGATSAPDAPPELDRDASEPSIDAEAAADPPCPQGMLLVEGDYCPKLKHKCLHYLDEAGGTFLTKHRCAEFARDPSCESEREHRRFCIDRDEYVADGDELPLVDQSWTGAKEICESNGKRLCFESEWEFACEGEAMLPYPYGFVRDSTRCNHDRSDLTTRGGKLRDHREPVEKRASCTSPFGVRNMIGNVDEWTVRDGFVRPWRASLRGGWWLAGRNNCRAATTGHDEYYFGPQTGFRCCKNAL